MPFSSFAKQTMIRNSICDRSDSVITEPYGTPKRSRISRLRGMLKTLGSVDDGRLVSVDVTQKRGWIRELKSTCLSYALRNVPSILSTSLITNRCFKYVCPSRTYCLIAALSVVGRSEERR